MKRKDWTPEVGDIVKQRKSSEYYSQSEEREGIVKKSASANGYYTVEWLDGDKNGYPKKQLKLVRKHDAPKHEEPKRAIQIIKQAKSRVHKDNRSYCCIPGKELDELLTLL